MHLWLHTDASYLNESKARSRNGGYFYLSSKPKLPIHPDDPPPPLNAPILVNSKIIDAVMSSVQESETGSGFINAKDAVPMRTTLTEMGHAQGPTPLQFDNKCAVGILTDTVVQRRSKAMDMRFYWIRDRQRQNQFHVHWKRAQDNLADYPTKHHSTKHHISVRPTYVLNNLHDELQLQPSYAQRYCKGVLTHNTPNASKAQPLSSRYRTSAGTAQPLSSRYRTCPLLNNNTVAMHSNRHCQNPRLAFFATRRTHN
jgi:hypothetical protein